MGGLLVVAALGLSASPGLAQLELLFRGTLSPAPARPIEVDPLLPTGRPLLADHAARPRVPGDWRACSRLRPVCVHTAARAPQSAVRARLAALENAHRALVGVLRLPAPRADLGLGGGPELDLYVQPGAAPLEVRHDLPTARHRDGVSAFCVVGEDNEDSAARAATLCVGEAMALAVDAAQGPAARRALGTYLWWLTGAPEAADARVVDDAQSAPEQPLWEERTRAEPSGALLLDYLERSRGRGDGSLAVALGALATRATPRGAYAWRHEPDLFDILRASFDGRDHGSARLFGDFARARAFLGGRDTEGSAPSLLWLGSAGRVRFDWAIPWSSLPRTLAPRRPIFPTGAMFVWLAIDRPVENLTLGLRATWEPPVAFQWLVVKVARDGRALATLELPYLERATSVERSVTELGGVAGLLVVGSNLGGVDVAHPYDPDIAPLEPSGCTVYLAALP